MTDVFRGKEATPKVRIIYLEVIKEQVRYDPYI